ncbi:hypothetical protein KSP39_PZI004093 [Platanthera zijinensis]|uniref:Uncharacterized protein n=1 Tax=Platanthera zijinensis TaxID=2320716 RepID=A0AAP0GCU5_9ASPA
MLICKEVPFHQKPGRRCRSRMLIHVLRLLMHFDTLPFPRIKASVFGKIDGRRPPASTLLRRPLLLLGDVLNANFTWPSTNQKALMNLTSSLPAFGRIQAGFGRLRTGSPMLDAPGGLRPHGSGLRFHAVHWLSASTATRGPPRALCCLILHMRSGGPRVAVAAPSR